MIRRLGRMIRPFNQVLYAIPGDVRFVVPQGVYSLTVYLRGGGGGAGGGVANGYDGWSPGAGASGYNVQNQTISVTPGQILQGVVGKGGIGGAFSNTAGGDGETGGTTTFAGLSAVGGGGGQGSIAYQYVQRAGGIGLYNGSVGATLFSEYYIGGNGAGTTEPGQITIVNGPACQSSRGGHSTITHPLYKIQQFPLGNQGAPSDYVYSAQFTAYYGRGGGGAGDLGPGVGLHGGKGGGGGGGSYSFNGGRGGDGYILIRWG